MIKRWPQDSGRQEPGGPGNWNPVIPPFPVYCVSCAKAMHIGGKRPRYLVDLLFGEATPVGTFEPEAWHREVEQFIGAH
jgi:hypothetical protein